MEIISGKGKGPKDTSFEVSGDADPSFNSDMLESFDHFEDAEPKRRR